MVVAGDHLNLGAQIAQSRGARVTKMKAAVFAWRGRLRSGSGVPVSYYGASGIVAAAVIPFMARCKDRPPVAVLCQGTPAIGDLQQEAVVFSTPHRYSVRFAGCGPRETIVACSGGHCA